MSDHSGSRLHRRARGAGLAVICIAILAIARQSTGVRAHDGDAGGAVTKQVTKQVTWALYGAAPYMIAEGADRDHGIFDQIRHILDDRLPDYAHHTLSAPFPRIVSSLRDGAEWCFVGGVKTPEREAFATFSRPIALFYPLRIVVHAPQRARFAAQGPQSLRTLLQDRNLRTSTLRDRALSPDVDALFRRYPPSQVYSDFDEAFRMLLDDRLDYLVDYPSIAAFSAKQLGQEGAFVELPFAEAAAPIYSRVMCPKTEWGRQLIERIDAVLTTERPTRAYRHIVEQWSESGDVATIRNVYDAAFLKSE